MTLPYVALGDLCTVVTGGTPSRNVPTYWGGDIPWVKISDLATGTVANTEERITKRGLDNSTAKLLPAGTILLSIFASIGRTAVLRIPAATNQAIVGLQFRDGELVDSAFVRWYLSSVGQALAQQGRGVAQANINTSILKALRIPLPPLGKQRRIAAILDQADALRAQRRKALKKLESLAQSVFFEMFGEVAGNTKHWASTTTLGDVADIVSGVTKGRKLSGAARTVPYLAVANVQDKALALDNVKLIDASEDEISRYRLKRNDLLLTEGGDPDKLGRGTLWQDELPECIHQNHVFRVRLHDERLTPLFLNWLVGSPRGKRYFLRSAKQTTGIASINMTQLRGFPLLEPPLALQRLFEERIQGIQSLEVKHRASLTHLDALFASLQHRAFRGEL